MYEVSVLNALATIKYPATIMAQRTLLQVHAQTAGCILELRRQLEVRGRRARAIGATRRHDQQQQQQQQ